MISNKNHLFASTQSFITSKWILPSGVLSLVMLITLAIIDQHLSNQIAVYGIISFELSGSLLESLKIITSWNSTAQIYAGFSLGLDYFFLFAYSFFLYATSVHLATQYKDKMIFVYRIGLSVGLLQLSAGLLDAIENYMLLRLLSGSYDEIFSILAYYCASVKFIFVGIGMLYILSILLTTGMQNKFIHRSIKK